MTALTRRGVTVVVPVYDDLPGIERCLRSVLEVVDPGLDEVVVMNDCGPSADEVEALVTALLDGRAGARYERNERNLGFVGTCNRAAELDRSGRDLLLLNSDTVVETGFVDELAAVLEADPAHGIVCARSNNATIASIPYFRRHPKGERTVARAKAVHAAVAPQLPRYAVTPVAMGFCFLVRRELVDAHGLFDVAFAPGYGEENDFCLRMNEQGHLAVIANRVFVAHVGAQSFSGWRGRALRAVHERLLNRRHPYYPAAVATYLQHDLDPVDRFADVLLPDDAGVKVLVDSTLWGGDRRVRDRLLRAAQQLAAPDFSLTITAPFWQVGGLRRRFAGLQVRRRRHLDELFDVAVLRASTATGRALLQASRHAARWLGVIDAPAVGPAWRERMRAIPARAVAIQLSLHAAALATDPVLHDRVRAVLGREPDHLVDADEALALFAAARETAGRAIDVDALRRRHAHLASAGHAFGRDPLQRASLRVRVVRQLEWIAPAPLAFARRLRARLR